MSVTDDEVANNGNGMGLYLQHVPEMSTPLIGAGDIAVCEELGILVVVCQQQLVVFALAVGTGTGAPFRQLFVIPEVDIFENARDMYPFAGTMSCAFTKVPALWSRPVLVCGLDVAGLRIVCIDVDAQEARVVPCSNPGDDLWTGGCNVVAQGRRVLWWDFLFELVGEDAAHLTWRQTWARATDGTPTCP